MVSSLDDWHKERQLHILNEKKQEHRVEAIMWGCCINDAVCKSLQFQTSASIATLILTYLPILAPAEEVAAVVQLLWINAIIDTFATLALATDLPSRSVKQEAGYPRNATAHRRYGQDDPRPVDIPHHFTYSPLPWPRNPWFRSHRGRQQYCDDSRVQHLSLRSDLQFPQLQKAGQQTPRVGVLL